MPEWIVPALLVAALLLLLWVAFRRVNDGGLREALAEQQAVARADAERQNRELDRKSVV